MFSKNMTFVPTSGEDFPNVTTIFQIATSSFPPKVLALCQLGDASAVAEGMDLDSWVMDQRILAHPCAKCTQC